MGVHHEKKWARRSPPCMSLAEKGREEKEEKLMLKPVTYIGSRLQPYPKWTAAMERRRSRRYSTENEIMCGSESPNSAAFKAKKKLDGRVENGLILHLPPLAVVWNPGMGSIRHHNPTRLWPEKTGQKPPKTGSKRNHKNQNSSRHLPLHQTTSVKS